MVLGCGGAGTAIMNSCFPGGKKEIPSKNHWIGTNRGRLGKGLETISLSKKLILEESNGRERPQREYVTASSQQPDCQPHGDGKRPSGSPVPKSIEFPERAIVWDLNYRGSLEFYRYSQEQETVEN
ncbi:MAG: hypothetical protein CM1200mP28_00370 [Deltaproteobacteria bacterium]|nr:MAG: hypothetical protein CM1200mP28_00370 [Deltaproteobacteria bacterium]